MCAENGTAVGNDTAVGDESGTTVGARSSTAVGTRSGMKVGAGSDTGVCDSTQKLLTRANLRNVKGRRQAGSGTAVGAGIGTTVGARSSSAVGT